MLGFEEGWDERGRELGKETSKVRIQRDSRPETLELNKTRTQKDGQMVERKGENHQDNRALRTVLGAFKRQVLTTGCLFAR